MTKSDLIERLCLGQKLPKGKAELLVDTIFDCLEQALRRGERIEIRGFGSFEIRSYKAYQGRNPKTGVPVPVREKRLPFFKVGKELKERVNPGGDHGDDGHEQEEDGSDEAADGHDGSQSASETAGDGVAKRSTQTAGNGLGTDGAATQSEPGPLAARE
jgi:integration host factor subunit beta